MKRRAFITLIGGAAAAWPLTARAQQGKVWRIGFLETIAAAENAPNMDAFRQGMRGHGYFEKQNFVIEYRSADGRSERYPALAAELVRLNVDLIVTRATPAVIAVKNATATIPIVMAASGDPVGTGVAACCARAASGHPTAPPSSMMNARRFIRSPRRRGRAMSAAR